MRCAEHPFVVVVVVGTALIFGLWVVWWLLRCAPGVGRHIVVLGFWGSFLGSFFLPCNPGTVDTLTTNSRSSVGGGRKGTLVRREGPTGLGFCGWGWRDRDLDIGWRKNENRGLGLRIGDG